MGIYEELKARGLIAQVTDEEQIRDLVNNGKATFFVLGTRVGSYSAEVKRAYLDYLFQQAASMNGKKP